MENNLVGFKEYNGKKLDLLKNITVEPGDIIFGIDSETDLPYIYHNGVFYSDASEWSEALPEIHIGKTAPSEKKGFKLWIDTNDNPLSLKYKDATTNKWVSTNEIYIGDTLPEDTSNIKVWYQTNADLPEEDIVVSWEDVENKPTFADIAFSGSYTDLKDVPDTIKKTYYAHGQVDRSKYTLTDEQLIDNINTQKSIENKENANYIIHIVDTDKYYPVNKVSQEASYVKTLYAVVFEDDDNNIGNNIVNPIVTSVKLNIHNGEILGGNPNGGSGDAFVDSAYLSTEGYVNSHTTTYIGKEDPSDLDSKYNLWVDTTKEKVVFKYKEGNEWKVLSTGDSGSIEVDTLLDPTSKNPIANKTVYELATTIGENFEAISKDLLKKASTENGLVEGRGFKVNDNLKYYLPNTTTTTDPTVDDTHIIATKADVLSNEVIDSKATVYNLYAMDDLTPEQVAANEAALVSVQNREVAIYKVYTNDDTYAIADVKVTDDPYLEAYVYVSNPNEESKQATITKYTYTFTQAGEYTTSDKEEVVVPSLSKVEEMVGTSGGSNGLEIRILSDDTPEENLRTIELVKEGKALAGLDTEEGVDILYYAGDRNFYRIGYVEDWKVQAVLCVEVGEDGKIISLASYLLTGDMVINSTIEFIIWLRWQTLLSQVSTSYIRTIYVVEGDQRCLVDSISIDSTTTEFQYNYNDKRYKRVYTNETGEYTKEEIVVNSGGGTGGSSVGGLETRIVYIPSYTSNNTTLTNEEKEYNLETCRKLLNGTARAALSLEGDTAGVYALNTYCEDILDLSVLGEEGYYIPFKWTYMVQLGATIIGNDGDILLFGGGQSTTVSDLILNEDLSNLGDIGSAAMEQYSGGKLPTVYYVENDMGSLLQLVPLHPFGMFSSLGILFQGIGESLDGNTQTKYNLSCYNAATNQPATFEATPIATKIYIGKPSTEHKNINKAFANSPVGALGIGPMPALVYEDSSSAEILRWKSYQPLEKYIVPNLDSGDWGDYTHIEFLIFREGKYERWKLDMEGETSLIE